jgi:hypothetical protein
VRRLLGQCASEKRSDCAARDDPEDEHQPYPRMTGRQEPVIRAALTHHKREHRHSKERAADEADQGEDEIDANDG